MNTRTQEGRVAVLRQPRAAEARNENSNAHEIPPFPSARSARAGIAQRAIPTSLRCRSTMLAVVLTFLALGILLITSADAAEADTAFDAANKLYEQGRHAEAAAAYEKLVQTNPRSESLLFNLGNAHFKAGQTGRAIAAWREAERLAPREPGIRFNLQFARKKVTGQDTSAVTLGTRTLAALTANEWTVLAALAFWIWCGLLVAREYRPALRSALSGYTAIAGILCLALVACVAAASNRLEQAEAVVTVPDAILRSGPLEEAKVLHQLRDGTELLVLDRKSINLGAQPQTWLQVRDAQNRAGWLKSDQAAELRTVQ